MKTIGPYFMRPNSIDRCSQDRASRVFDDDPEKNKLAKKREDIGIDAV